MLIQGSARTNRTQLLIDKYKNLLKSGVSACEILVLLQNSYKKDIFLNALKLDNDITHFENPQIYTFYGLCYNTIKNCWTFLENHIKQGTTTVSPKLTGLEISQFFIRKAIKEVGFQDYNSKINLIHQLFRRYSLIVNNNLSDSEVDLRSNILNETFAHDAQKALELYKKKTLEYRAFDYIRQVSLFQYIYKNTNYFNNIKYLIIDDADEITPAELNFVSYIKPQVEDFVIGYDRYGSSRLGFLNTDIKTVDIIEKICSADTIENLDEIKTFDCISENMQYTRRLEMIENALNNVVDLISTGVSPSEITIVSPIIDSALKFYIKEKFEPLQIDYQYLSGSEKLCDNKIIKNIINILKLSFEEKIDVFEIRTLLSTICKIPLKYCIKIVENYTNTGLISYFDLDNDFYNNRLKTLIETMDKVKSINCLSEKLYILYENLVIDKNIDGSDIEKFNFFYKQILDFEDVFFTQKDKIDFQKSVLKQIENSIISENPSVAPDIKCNALVIATAQKVIDFSLKSKYQVWLDTSSVFWIRDDFGTLYNAWVFQKSWNKDDFTYDDNIKFSQLKIHKMLRKLSLLASKKVFAYSSLFDSQGAENFGGIDEYILKTNNDKKNDNKIVDFNFKPRDDQKPVLSYKNGHMAISAVPGAGKTTILLALIIKLLQTGEKSENIFVLTYMESAARNFKERIKLACPNLEKLPNISTIHGLALRILKENSNYVKAGLAEDFEVCDDSTRQKIMHEILAFLNYSQDDFDKYLSAVSAVKLSNISKISFTKDVELKRFLKFYDTYNKYLKNKNLIDYDDMLLYCVKILEENKDISDYYQNLCKFLIEDEAQDSSAIQQRLLSILSGKYKNLIRCGDINQAITATFTNADLDGFRNFVNNSSCVTMDHSQRCARDIYTLANKLIEFSKSNNDFKNAFFDIKMKEVAGKNPKNNDAIESKIFDDYIKEREFLLEKIRNIFKMDPTASVAILVRNNYNIEEYAEFLSGYGYTVSTRSDCLNRQPVFLLVQHFLEYCAHPWRNEVVIKLIKVFYNQRLLNITQNDIDYVKSLKTPFILQNSDELPSNSLSCFLWDLNYWLENSFLPIEEFTLKVGNYYYDTEIEKSNVYMIALFLKNFEQQYKTRDIMLEKLNEFSLRSFGSTFNFFSNEQQKFESHDDIQIMTYHKSKGDEFDYVFIPGFDEETLCFNKNNVKIKSKERFLEAVKGLNSKYKIKNEDEQKLIQVEENLRLFYVAVTRAKKKLFVTASKKIKKYSRVKDSNPSELFDELLNSIGVNNE